MEERSSDPRTEAEAQATPAVTRCCAVILLDLDVPDGVPASVVTSLFKRWEQDARFRALQGGVVTGDVHARVLGLTTGQLLAAFDLFADAGSGHE